MLLRSSLQVTRNSVPFVAIDGSSLRGFAAVSAVESSIAPSGEKRTSRISADRGMSITSAATVPFETSDGNQPTPTSVAVSSSTTPSGEMRFTKT